MNNAELARKAGVARASIRKYLNGTLYTRRTIIKIEKGLVEYYKEKIKENMDKIEKIEKENNELGWKISKIEIEEER